METNANTEAKKTVSKRTAKRAGAKRTAAKRAGAKRTAKPVNRGGGRALGDFKDTDKIRVLKPKEIARKDCFRTGQTVRQCITLQGKKGYHGRRKYVRKQIALGRIKLSAGTAAN